jgi:hypothetical protein
MSDEITPSDKRRLAAKRAEKVLERTARRERGDWRQAAKVRKTPVFIEVMSREQLFVHDCGLVFWRKIKTHADGTCNLCEAKCRPAEIPGFAFARRRAIFDDDAWLMELCRQCFDRPDLVEKVRAYVHSTNQEDDPDQHEVVSVRLVGAKS